MNTNNANAGRKIKISPAEQRILTCISEGAEISGGYSSNHGLALYGKLHGDIEVKSAEPTMVIIGNTGVVYGSVKASAVLVDGLVYGSVTGAKVILTEKAVINGDVLAKELIKANGHTVKGTVRTVG